MTRYDLARVRGRDDLLALIAAGNPRTYNAEIVPQEDLIVAMNECAASLQRFASFVGNLAETLLAVPDFATREGDRAEGYQTFDPEGVLSDLAKATHAYETVVNEITLRQCEAAKIQRQIARERVRAGS